MSARRSRTLTGQSDSDKENREMADDGPAKIPKLQSSGWASSKQQPQQPNGTQLEANQGTQRTTFSQRDWIHQQIDEQTDKNIYDPQQDDNEKREIRRQYRILHEQINENRINVLVPDDNTLQEAVDRTTDLFKNVKTTAEATLDSEVLITTTDLAAKKARLLQVGDFSLSLQHYMDKLRLYLGHGGDEMPPIESVGDVSARRRSGASSRHGTVNGDTSSLYRTSRPMDWAKLGRVAMGLTRNVNVCGFMLGPLSVERKERRAAQMASNAAALKYMPTVRPTELRSEDINQQENTTTANVMMVYKYCRKHAPIQMFKFFINPEHFGQTVENLFYLSFLVRDGLVRVLDDQQGMPILHVAKAPTPEEIEENGYVGHQAVVDMSWPIFKVSSLFILSYKLTEKSRNASKCLILQRALYRLGHLLSMGYRMANGTRGKLFDNGIMYIRLFLECIFISVQLH